MKILVATPVAKYVEERYAHSLFGLCKYETMRGNDVDLILQRGPYIHFNRNKFVREFLKGQWEWLVQIDMDVSFPVDAIERMLKHEQEAVFGMYAMLKNGKPLPTFFRLAGDGKYDPMGEFGGGLIEIDAGGTGLCTIHRGVFERIEGMRPNDKNPWFDFESAPPPDNYFSEDITFCRRAKAAGVRLYGDCDIETLHTKDVMIPNTTIGRKKDGKESKD